MKIFGEKVSSQMLGIGGIAVGANMDINGCSSFQIQPLPKDDSDEVPKRYWRDAEDLGLQFEDIDVDFALDFGEKAKDRISGFEGIIVAKYAYINGTVQYGIKPESLHDGAPIDAHYFDEGRLIENSPVKKGGPHEHNPGAEHIG